MVISGKLVKVLFSRWWPVVPYTVPDWIILPHRRATLEPKYDARGASHTTYLVNFDALF